AIGAEYSIGPPMLAEFSPSKGRGRRLCSLQVCWYVGFLAAVLVAYGMVALGVDWRLILATGAVPALATLLLRYGLPESPRWLMSQGRDQEAREIVNQNLGEDYFDDEDLAGESTKKPSYRDLFAPDLRSRTAFVCIFYTALVAPYFAIFTFAPLVFKSLGTVDPRASVVGSNAIAVLGAFVGMFVIERMGRRRLLIGCFWIMVVTLAIIGGWSGAPSLVIVGCFVLFAFFNAISGDLTGVYPSEIFPSELRATGVGLASAASRVGAAGGTFLLPIGIAHIGVGPSVLIGAAIALIGAVATHLLAPETTNLTLTKSPKAEAPRRRDKVAAA
ncbi:MAG: MFS transporter, partial [Nocardioidaceae bacterium]|nr:MFS transporter [Nocardioidaceae bacterium]